MSRTALAFMSYVNLDDQHEQGRLTRFREYLSGEVRMQTGERFDIFQDRKDIAWGQQWQKRIDESLDAVTFLIPIITPGFFKSDACREELERFLKREETLGRSDLILPVYYVNCPVLSDKAKREHDKLAQVIAKRQYVDWTKLRPKPLSAVPVRKALAKMAQQIMEALERSQAEASRQQPEEDIVEPKASIAGPALQGLAFAHEEQSLKDMYLNLLATAMDGRVATTAHPAFVEIIKQLDGKDAMLASYILRLSVLMPIVQIHLTTAGEKSYTTVATHLIALSDAQSGKPIDEPQLPAMIDNLVRLGLVEVNYNRRVTGTAAYDWVKTRPEYIRLREEHENEKVKLTYQKGLITRTQFGQRFAAAVGLLAEHELSITDAAERE